MKKFMNVVLGVVLVVLTLAGCGNNVDKVKYFSVSQEICEKIYEESIILGNYTKYLSNYWSTINKFNSNAPGIKTDFDADTAIKYTNDWIAEKSGKTRNDIDTAYEEIKAKYNELGTMKTDNSLEEVKASVDILYNLYCELYATGTNPSGTVKEYSVSTTDNLKQISDEYDKLTQLFNENGVDVNGKKE